MMVFQVKQYFQHGDMFSIFLINCHYTVYDLMDALINLRYIVKINNSVTI